MPFDFHISGLWLLPRNITDLDSNKMDTMQASISKISDMISNLQHKNIETVTDLGPAVKKNDTLTNSDRDSDDDPDPFLDEKAGFTPTFKGTDPIGLLALTDKLFAVQKVEPSKLKAG